LHTSSRKKPYSAQSSAIIPFLNGNVITGRNNADNCEMNWIASSLWEVIVFIQDAA